MHFYNTYGIRYFKLDGVKIRSKLCEMRFIEFMQELVNRTKGDMRFNLDVTAEDRFGYMYMPQFGTLFVIVQMSLKEIPQYFFIKKFILYNLSILYHASHIMSNNPRVSFVKNVFFDFLGFFSFFFLAVFLLYF